MRWRRLLPSLSGLLVAQLAAAAERPFEVRPGGVVAWRGEAATACFQGGRRSLPLGGACYFAIDLLATGEIEVARTTAAGREARRLRVGPYPYPVQEITGVEEKYVSPSPADQARIARENARIGQLWKLDSPRRFSLPLATPLRSLPAGGRFGARRVFNGEPRSPHGGADYRAGPGTPVLAVADGTVALAEEHFFAGRAVYLDHGDGLISMSFHLSEIAVREGQQVERGQVVGKVGATGRVTGPHLHFALRWRGARIDPALLFTDPEVLPAVPLALAP